MPSKSKQLPFFEKLLLVFFKDFPKKNTPLNTTANVKFWHLELA